ncbi:MAG TPA: hypothetical protein VF610_10090 [Segetibacter sp.]
MDKKQKQRTIIFYKDYFEEFFVKQRDKVKAKIVWTFDLIEDLEKVPETYLKHIEIQKDFLKLECSKEVTFFAYSASWTKDN